jgi:lipoprotein-releasing system permease protein
MRFSWFLALRYLKPKRSAFSVVTILSILGVLLGVGVLIVVIGVMSGFDRMIKEGILGLEPQIILTQVDASQMPEGIDAALMKDWRGTQADLKAHPLVKSVHPYVYITTLLESANQEVPEAGPEPEVSHFLGLDPENTAQIERIREMMVPEEELGGTFELGGDRVVISNKIASRLRVIPGDKVNAFSPENMKQVRKAWARREAAREAGKAEDVKSIDQEMDQLLAPTEFTVSGIFNPTQQHSDFVILSLEDAQMLNGSGADDRISHLGVLTDDAFAAESRVRQLFAEGAVPMNWQGRTWIDSHRQFFNAIQNERSMMYVVLMFIVIVATFSTSICMIIFAMQKKREISMVRALGASIGQVVTIFMSQGIVVGFFGVGLGVLGGSMILKFRNELRYFLASTFDINIFPAEIYGLPSIPAYLRLTDYLVICIPAFLLCAVAAVLPAFLSFREDPARALRGER